MSNNKVAKLSRAQWEEIKITWENDPRDGYAWLITTVTELGVTVTSKAILMRAKREGWAKKVSAKYIANQANRKADNKYKVDSVTNFVTVVTNQDQNYVTAVTSKEAEEKAIDLRTTIIQSHRDDCKRPTVPSVTHH